MAYPLLALSLLLARAAAQDASSARARLRVLGKVQARDGTPWSGAVVTLTGRTNLSDAGLEAVDRIRVTTDRRGRFSTRILCDRSYEAWAMLTTESGSRVTEPKAEIVPGEAIDLTEAEAQPMPITLEVHGLDAWNGRGMRLFIGPNEIVPDDDGRVRVPTRAGSYAHVEGRVGDRVLFRHFILLRRESREEVRRVSTRPGKPVPGLPDVAELGEPALDVERLLVPPPLAVTVRVIDKASKKPVSGASVQTRDELGRAIVHTTGADGRARFVIAHPIDRFGRHWEGARREFAAVAGGYVLRRTGWHYRRNAPLLKQSMIDDGKLEELTVELVPGYRFKGKLLLPDGIATGGLQVLYELTVNASDDPSDFESIPLGPREVRVAETGTWTISGLGKRSPALYAQLVLPRALTAGLTSRLPEVPTLRRLPLPIHIPVRPRGDLDASFDLRRLRAVDVAFENENGGVAEYVNVVVMPEKAQVGDVLEIADRFRSDRRGRCRAFAVGDETVVFATTKTHYAYARVGSQDHLKVTLSPCARFSGRVVDRNGKPVAGARIYTRGVSWSGNSPFRMYTWAWNRDSLRTITGPDGRFSLRWIPRENMTLDVAASVDVHDRSVDTAKLQLFRKSVEDAVLTLDVDAKSIDKHE